MSSKPFAWSYSVLGQFETCPRQYYEVKIAKTAFEKPSPQMTEGNRVHKALELALKDNKPLEPQDAGFAPLVETVKRRAEGGILEAEQKMAINKDLRPTTYFGHDVWCRAITDFTVVKKSRAFIGDWKTGQETPASAQLKLTAAMTMIHKPWVNEVITAFVWLKTGRITPETYTRANLPEIWDHFNARVSRMEDAITTTRFPPRPSGLCRAHCPAFTCPHNGRKGH